MSIICLPSFGFDKGVSERELGRRTGVGRSPTTASGMLASQLNRYSYIRFIASRQRPIGVHTITIMVLW